MSAKCYVTLTKACLRCNIRLTKVKENIPQPHSSHQQGKVSGVGSNPNKASQNPLNDDDLSIQCIQPGFAATFNFWCMFPSVVCSALLFLYNFKISRASQMLLFLIYKYVERRCYFFLFQAFKDAFKQARSIILASGTLHPIETLRTKLGQ